jgi:hypothetical protein
MSISLSKWPMLPTIALFFILAMSAVGWLRSVEVVEDQAASQAQWRPQRRTEATA